MVVHNIQSKKEFEDAVGDHATPMLIDCFATWCGPCKAIAPQVEKISEAFAGKLRVYKIDVDQLSEVAQELGIRAMPTFLVYSKGEKVKEVVGANPAAIESAVKEVVPA